MVKSLNKNILIAQAAFTVTLLQGITDAKANDFSDISQNIITSVENIPGLLTGLAYLMGLLMGVLGVLKVKDHVENPSQTPLKDGAIRMASGGALFALPIVFEAMQNTIGTTGASVGAAPVNPVAFNLG